MMNVSKIELIYAAPKGHRARAYWIPMSMYDDVREAYKHIGIAIRTKFRGPRASQVGIKMGGKYPYTRTKRMASQNCLKAYATHFSVYDL